MTFSEDEASLASTRLDRVEAVDLNHVCFNNLGRYDCIICSHVLEHSYEPESLLRGLWDHCLTPEGFLVVALPNVLYWKQRLRFCLGVLVTLLVGLWIPLTIVFMTGIPHPILSQIQAIKYSLGSLMAFCPCRIYLAP